MAGDVRPVRRAILIVAVVLAGLAAAYAVRAMTPAHLDADPPPLGTAATPPPTSPAPHGATDGTVCQTTADGVTTCAAVLGKLPDPDERAPAAQPTP